MATRDPLGHSLLLLRWMAEQPETWFGVRDVASRLDMSPSSVSRLLGRLADEDLLKQDAQNGRYALSLELMRLGRLVADKLDITAIARQHLQHVSDLTNETVFLGLYDPARRQMLLALMSAASQPLTYTLQLNSWLELFRGASGLSILAFLPPEQRDALVGLAEADARDDEPWLSRESIQADMAEIRHKGYGLSHGHRLRGAIGVSAPVFDVEGNVVASVTLTIPDVRWADHDETEVSELVVACAASITRELGGHTSTSFALDDEPTRG